jgi:hypothetical protein
MVTNPDLICISDFKSRLNPDRNLKSGFKIGFNDTSNHSPV